MAQAKTSAEFNNFIAGLNTESSLINFAENASRDEENFVLNKSGTRQRRLGLDYETSNILISAGISSANLIGQAVSVHQWDNANLSGTFLYVIQVGLELYFFDTLKNSISSNQLNSGNSLTITGSFSKAIETTVVAGKFIIGSGSTFVTVLSYDSALDVVSSSTTTISVRDIFGIDDGLSVEDRPVLLSNKHKYNLLNQGWNAPEMFSMKSSQSVFPSNADIVFLGKDSNDSFDGDKLIKQFFGSSHAPRGRYILDLFARGSSRNSQSGVVGLPSDITVGGINSVASFAGRVFYTNSVCSISGGDDNSPTLSNLVAFSQTLTNISKLGKCYQEADPTSEHVSDLVDTDGGTVHITDADTILKLISLSNSLLVFANNGVWQIVGGDVSGGFSATAFQVIKVTDIGVKSVDSIVAALDSILYWAEDGIYAISSKVSSDTVISGAFSAQNITETTIQTLFEDIPSISRRHVKGIFDSRQKQIRWLYNDDTNLLSTQFQQTYNKELILDLVLSAFSKFSIKNLTSNSPFVVDFVLTKTFVENPQNLNVIVVSDNVIAVSDNVVSLANIETPNNISLKYLTFVDVSNIINFTFSVYNDTTFKDWVKKDSVGIDADAFLLTGPFNFDDNTRRKQALYLFVQLELTETGYTVNIDNSLDFTNASSCLVQGRWDYSDSANSGKWTSFQQVYRLNRNYIPSSSSDTFDFGKEVIITKSKLRGSGKALSLFYKTEPEKDLRILGWSIPMLGSTDE